MLFTFENVTFGYDGVPTVENVSFSLHEGEHVGLLGGNGEGKTTLLRLLVGELLPDSGKIIKKNGLRLGYLEQSGGFEADGTAQEALEAVFAEDERLLKRLEEAQQQMRSAREDELSLLASRCESLQKQIAARDSYSYPVRIRTVLGGMGLSALADHPVSTMSGGEKTKLRLCRLLLESPDLLILDEPTNHLDLKTLFWLEDYLSAFKGATLFVSHDRYFLDRLTARTLELERGKVTSYKGNYSKYRVLKAEHFLTAQRAYEKQQEEIARLQEYVDRNIVRATTAKSALSRKGKLENMEVLPRPLPPPAPPRFRFRMDRTPHETVLQTETFDLTAGGKLLLHEAEVTILRGMRCAVVGANGTGKTTLLRYLLSGDAKVRIGQGVKIAYYDQEQSDLDGEDRVLDAFWGKNALLPRTDAQALLAQAGLDGEDVQKKVKELSGGQRAKLALALLEARQGNFLVLDEPTNHLDLPARESLEDALDAFQGTLLFVSHDRRFISRLANCVLSLEDKKLTLFQGSYEAFLAAQTQPKSEAQPSPVKRTDGGYRSAQDRAREAKRRSRIKEIETRIEECEKEIAEVDEALSTSYSDYLLMRSLAERRQALQEETDALYAEYETLV